MMIYGEFLRLLGQLYIMVQVESNFRALVLLNFFFLFLPSASLDSLGEH